jgi:hypothetical protein
MTDRVEQLAWTALAGGWLVVFAITAGVANAVRPVRRRGAANRGSGPGRSRRSAPGA